jgi:NDP-sugar pyrophosphorylase family protein
MVLAAGLGTRLKPLTDTVPKALVKLGSKTMLELTLARLKAAGATDVIVNAHHHADVLESFIKTRDFGVKIAISREDVLLDTGGGLKKAAWFFGDGKPFLVHNVDVVTDLDLRKLYRFHAEGGATATLAAHKRETKRPLVFDRAGRLVGRVGEGEALAFMGIHAVSPDIFDLITEDGVFPIVDSYARLAKDGEPIVAYRDDKAFWRDIGTPAKLEEAAKSAAAKGLL